MSEGIYTPFFIHPSHKKRAATGRKRQILQDETFVRPVIDIRTRRPNSANGNGECIFLPNSDECQALCEEHEQASSSKGQKRVIIQLPGPSVPSSSSSSIQTRSSKRMKMGDDNRQMRGTEQTLHDHDIIHDVGAEEEVNVEDDLSEPGRVASPTDSLIESGKRQVEGNKSFDPESCYDVAELRDRLMNAYEKIDQLSMIGDKVSMNYRALKQDSYYLKNEFTKSENRVSQLESIILEKNMRLEKLLKENVFMSARLKRIQNEFGIDAVKEVFNRVDTIPRKKNINQ